MHTGTELALGERRGDRRIMQQAKRGVGSVEPAFEEIRLKSEIEREAAMQIASQPPDAVEVIEHGVAKARHVRPEIGGPKRRARKQLGIVRRKLEADVE